MSDGYFYFFSADGDAIDEIIAFQAFGDECQIKAIREKL